MNLLEKLSNIKAFVFDIDGVLTKNNIIILNDGQIVRQINIKDNYALNVAIKNNFKILILSGGNSLSIKNALNDLGINDIYLNTKNKKNKLIEWSNLEEINLENILYMGDDLPDYESIKIAGIGSCPNDAANEIKQISNYISQYNGGEGCVRDVIEKVLKLNKKWDIQNN